MQKIAISAEGPTLEDWVDPRFGRAGGFVTVELPERKLDYIDNGASQIMAMGAGIVSEELAMQIVDKWLDTPFSNEPRHQRRIDKVMALEK